VWVPYCTSDGWLGDVSAGDADMNYPTGNGTQAPLFPGGFRGARVVRAVVTSLVKKEGLGSTQSSRVLFGGCTPGAVANLDSFAEQMLAEGVKPVDGTVQGIFDSAMLLDVAPIAPGPGRQAPPAMAAMAQAAYALMNGSALVKPACAAAYANETWRCVFGQYSLPFVATPYLLVQPQFDRAQLMYDGGPRPGSSNASVQYALAFQAAAQQALAGLPTAAQSRSAVVSSACFSYCTSLTAAFWNSPVARSPGGGGRASLFAGSELRQEGSAAPLTLDAALTLWFFKGERRLRVVDECVGWRCGQCHAAKGHPPPTRAQLAAENHSAAVGPILVGTFAVIVLVGCCLACASQEAASKRRNLLAGGGGEATPLLSTQLTSPPFQGVMPRAKASPAVPAL